MDRTANVIVKDEKLKRPSRDYSQEHGTGGVKGIKVQEDENSFYSQKAKKAKSYLAAYTGAAEGLAELPKGYKAARAKYMKLSVPRDARLKKPPRAYSTWLSDKRIYRDVKKLIKKTGEMWKGLADKNKKLYLQAKEEYDAYLATSKGATALKAYNAMLAEEKSQLAQKIGKAKEAKAQAKAQANVAAKQGTTKAAKEKAQTRSAARRKKAIAKARAKAKATAAKSKKVERFLI